MLVGIVFVLLLALVAFGILMIFYYSKVLNIVYCSIGILLFSIMIIIGEAQDFKQMTSYSI